jgi:hypothetical protein
MQAMEVQEHFIPLVVLENAFRYWWLVALFIFAGGLGGLLVNTLNAPLYEATAQFSVAIDFVSTGPLSQYEEDLAINAAGNIFVSTEVLQRVVDQAVNEGINTSLADLHDQIFIERNFSVWNIRVRDRNPETAEKLTAIWMNQGETILLQSYQHAIKADQLERYILSQEFCLKKLVASEPPSDLCNSTQFTEIQKNLLDAGAAIYQERQASRGIFAGLTPGPFNAPVLSPEPVSVARNQSVFLGSLLGLIISIVFIESGVFPLKGMKS